MKLSEFVVWSESQIMDTKLGKRKVFRGHFKDQKDTSLFFKEFWKEYSQDMKKQGFTTWKGDSGWQIISWHTKDDPVDQETLIRPNTFSNLKKLRRYKLL